MSSRFSVGRLRNFSLSLSQSICDFFGVEGARVCDINRMREGSAVALFSLKFLCFDTCDFPIREFRCHFPALKLRVGLATAVLKRINRNGSQ